MDGPDVDLRVPANFRAIILQLRREDSEQQILNTNLTLRRYHHHETMETMEARREETRRKAVSQVQAGLQVLRNMGAISKRSHEDLNAWLLEKIDWCLQRCIQRSARAVAKGDLSSPAARTNVTEGVLIDLGDDNNASESSPTSSAPGDGRDAVKEMPRPETPFEEVNAREWINETPTPPEPQRRWTIKNSGAKNSRTDGNGPNPTTPSKQSKKKYGKKPKPKPKTKATPPSQISNQGRHPLHVTHPQYRTVHLPPLARQ